MSSVPLTLSEVDILSAEHYGAHGYPHREWALLRRQAPVFRYIRRCHPFWAITKHEDVIWISKQPERFLIAPRLAVFPHRSDSQPASCPQAYESRLELRTLLNMDPPEHQVYRKLASPWFRPRSIARLEPRVTEIVGRLLDGFFARQGPSGGDFVEAVAAPLPLQVIAEILGVPEEDQGLVFQLSNQGLAGQDPDFRQEGLTPREASRASFRRLLEYFTELASQRRAEPRDDLVTVLAHAEIDGKPLPPAELMSYFALIAVPGHETTRNASAGALEAMCRHPEEWQRLRRDPTLIDSAVEEVLRWTSPVVHFARTATQDVELRGQQIHAGDVVVLFYPSANRDEEVFPEADRFRIDRSPNPHLAFGIGEHFCLGAHLARLELRVLLRELVREVEHLELAGEPSHLHSSMVSGFKYLPIRCRRQSA